eukprot:4197627-Pyramimonas_sp.AAC.2
MNIRRYSFTALGRIAIDWLRNSKSDTAVNTTDGSSLPAPPRHASIALVTNVRQHDQMGRLKRETPPNRQKHPLTDSNTPNR